MIRLGMAAKTPHGLHRGSHNFSSALSSALLEWLLMLLLFLDGLFSYMVTRFARSCGLQTPCLICSRLDHVLGNEKPGFYRDLICISHKSEISSSANCHVHQNLADVRDICEGCVLSFATEKKSHAETYRSLVGKLGVDIDDSDNALSKSPATVDSDDQNNRFYGEDAANVPLLNKDPVPRHCSCCSKRFKKKSHAISLLQSEPVGVDVGETGISLSCSTGQNYLSLHNGANMTTDETLVSSTIKYSGNNDFGPLSHIGYSELQVTSDSESDVPLSDDENGNTSVHRTRDFKEEFMNRCLQPDTFTIVPNSLSATLSDDQTQEKLIHIDPTLLETSPSVLEKQIDDGGSQDIPNMDSTTSTGHGLEELNRHRVEVTTDPSVPSEIINQSVPSEISNATLNALEVDDITSIANTLSGELSKGLSSTEMNMKTSQIMGCSGQSLQVPMDLNDTYKFVTGSKSSLTSPTSTEIIMGRDTTRVHEDLKSLISEISSTGGLESPWNDLIPSPRVNYQNEEFKFSDASSSAILQNITKRLSMERNESGLESLDGSMVSEIEGESITGRLKRQLELDRKSMNLLYKELEEERSASAIAANQAMAMITRLQEEKAAMQMEALQYQRMMEDQAEYDQEVLQNLNKLLSEREKEIQSLKVDVGSYTKQLRDDLLDDRKLQSFSYADSRDQDPTSTLPFDFRLSEIHLKDSLLDFEDEKIYISHCLKNLERKLRLSLDDGISVDESTVNTIVGIPLKSCDDFVGENYKQEDTMLEHTIRKSDHYSEEATMRNDLESPRGKDVHQEKSQTGDVLSEEKDPELGGNGHQKETSLCSVSVDDGQYTMVGRENDLDAFANELSLLTERLEALEADRIFLEHTINQLKSGDDGIQFVQEIAYHLREIRRIGIRHR